MYPSDVSFLQTTNIKMLHSLCLVCGFLPSSKLFVFVNSCSREYFQSECFVKSTLTAASSIVLRERKHLEPNKSLWADLIVVVPYQSVFSQPDLFVSLPVMPLCVLLLCYTT